MKKNLLSDHNYINTAVRNYYVDTVSFYEGSDVKKNLRARVDKMDDCIDMKFNDVGGGRIDNAWQMNVVMPLVAEAYMSRLASLSAMFDRSRLISLVPGSEGYYRRAKLMELVLLHILRGTQFQMNALEPVMQMCARYGTCPVVSYFQANEETITKTEPVFYGDTLIDIAPQKSTKQRKGVYTQLIHPLNYGQHPGIVDYQKSPYVYYHENPFVYQIIENAKKYPQFYIKKNVKKVVELAKKGDENNPHYTHANTDKETSDLVKTIPMTNWYGKLHSRGNEDDGKEYYIQAVGEHIIGIGINDNDYGTRPVDIYNLMPRHDRWCGSSDAERQVPMEGALNILLNIYTDSAIRQLKSFLVYDNSMGAIDTAQINEAMANDGFLGVNLRGTRRLNEVLYQYQFGGVNTHSLETAMNQVKEASQRTRAKGDFVRSANQGGLQNKTATASQIIANQANTEESYYLRQFGYGLTRHMTTYVRFLQQRLGRYTPVEENKDIISIAKEDILGEFIPIPNVLLNQDQIERQQRLHNYIAAVQNYKVSGDPTWLNVNLQDVIRVWSEENLGGAVDVNRVVPEMTPEMEQQAAMQQQMMYQQPMMQQQEIQPPQPLAEAA